MEISFSIKISKILSYALRHAPREYALKLDENGWGDLQILIENFNKNHKELPPINEDIITDLINKSIKKRLEINGSRIRALYGHSDGNNIEKDKSVPPNVLYHGTSFDNYTIIQKEGLKKMSRQYVHLTCDINDAEIVAKRKSDNIVILKIDSFLAYQDGIIFYNEGTIWLVENLSSEYIQRL